jgi:hypothetical protein
MDELGPLLSDLLSPENFISIVLSSPAKRGADSFRKVVGRPIVIKGRPRIQLEYFRGDKTTHSNLSPAEAATEVRSLLAADFKQAHVRTHSEEVHVLVRKDGTRTVSRKRAGTSVPVARPHDRKKEHVLPEGVPNPFLQRLGVMTEDGRVIASQRDKFQQVNRFLDMVADATANLQFESPLQIVDFGCGKAYLTFAVHHYFTTVRGLSVEMRGVDRKPDVIETCCRVAEEVGAEGLRFEVGGIESGGSTETADIVIALHACDTATDYALSRAVSMGAKVILAAPCCQHELHKQIDNPALAAMLSHGIIREKLTGLVTDSLRAALLRAYGYKVTLLEFVDASHTPKNILLRAVRTDLSPAQRQSALQEYRALREFWHVRPKLESLLSGG